MSKKVNIVILVIILLNIFSLNGCASSKTVSKTEFLLDTFVTIKIYGSKDMKIVEESLKLCEKYEKMFSKTIKNSDISRINQAKGKPVDVNSETAELIQIALDYYDISQHAFDITIGSITELWKFNASAPILPDRIAINDALSHVGSSYINIRGNTVTLSDPETKLDLGAIAKGYIADKIAEFLKEKGVAGIIDLGGNIMTVGEKPDNSLWTVGIRKPFTETGEILAAIKVGEKSVVSSGIYERYFYDEGTIYHHILDPETGYPYSSDLISVTIISDRSVDGDGLSTAVFCLGLENGLSFVESLDGVEAVFIPANGEYVVSSGIGIGTGKEIPIEWISETDEK